MRKLFVCAKSASDGLISFFIFYVILAEVPASYAIVFITQIFKPFYVLLNYIARFVKSQAFFNVLCNT